MSYLGIDLSTVNPNPSIDDTVNGGDGGAADVINIANSAMQWGSVIGSIVTNTPITAAQTRSGVYQTIGPAGSQVYVPPPKSINYLMIGAVVVGAVLIAVILRSK